MKKRYTYILAFAVAMMAAGACKHETNELAHHHHEHAAHEHEGGEGHEGHESHDHEAHDHSDHDDHDGHAGENEKASAAEKAHDADVIVLEPAVAERFGVTTDTAAFRPFSRVVKVSGTLSTASEGSAVVSAPTSGIVTLGRGISAGSRVGAGQTVAVVKADAVSGGDANRAAKVELDAAKTELERVESLYADRLVTLAQYNAAKAAYERAKAMYSGNAASGRATSPISGVITSLDVATGTYVATGTPIATVSASGRLVLRADVPFKSYKSVSGASDARIVAPYAENSVLVSELDGRRVDAGQAAAGAASGYVPVTFSLRNDGTLMPGSAVEVYLYDGTPRPALTVPLSALVEQQGSFFVFVRLDEDCYRKVLVEPGNNDGQSVEILSGLHGGENVVSGGVTAVKLAQSSGAVPAGHSHSH